MANLKLGDIPQDLRLIVEPEQPDFIVRSKRNYPMSVVIKGLVFGFLWCALTSVGVIGFVKPLFFDQDGNFHFPHLDHNNLPPVMIITVFILVGTAILVKGFLFLFQKGGYIASTPTRFIKYRRGEATITDWEHFTGNIQVSNNGKYGDLEFELRTGEIRIKSEEPDKFVPNKIYVAKIENVYQIQQICSKRIKENDPIPAVSLA